MSEKPAVPIHIGLILDGNRRWARTRGLPPLEGHRRGYENLKDIARAAFDRGVKYVSAYIFSTENWNRSADEVSYLMRLAHRMVKHDLKQIMQDGIRVRWLGSSNRVDPKLAGAIKKAEADTAHNTGGDLCLCFNYGGQQEISDAVQSLLDAGIKKINPAMITEHLYASDVPPVDLIIRTSGEQRISNFMLWRAAYAELYFVTKHWPDFSKADLKIALDDYAKRQRRFGV